MTRGCGARRGFSLVEVLVATAITSTVTVVACTLAVEALGAWRADSARIDLHQRSRALLDVLSRAVLDAGGGPYTGPARGSLVRFVPPLVPRRMGARNADGPGTFRRDAFTVIRTASEGEHAALLLAVPPGAADFELAPAPACALASCGFREGASVLLLDGRGGYDTYTVAAVRGMALTVRHHGPGAAAGYPAGSPVLLAESTSFYLDARERLLRVSDGDAADQPLADDVVGMEVEYYGERMAPVWPRAGAGEANCLYAADGSYNAAFMPLLPGGSTLVRLDSDLLTDGPWCGSGATLYDADLLRIRRVRITLRLQASDASVRGTDPARFRHPGTASHSARTVADLTLVVDATPRNLAQGW